MRDIKIGKNKYIKFQKPFYVYQHYPAPHACKCESPDNPLYDISKRKIAGLMCETCNGIIQVPGPISVTHGI
jgi:hypothetical protein